MARTRVEPVRSTTGKVLLGIIWSVIFGAVVGAAVYWASLQQPQTFAAQASVFAKPTAGAGAVVQDAVVPPFALEVYASAAETDEVVSRAATRLSVGSGLVLTPDAIRDAVSVSIERAPSPTTGFVHVRATARAETAAVGIANAVSEELVAWHYRRAADQHAEALAGWQERVAALDGRIADLMVNARGAVEQSELSSLIAARATAVTQVNALEAMTPVGLLELFSPATGRARVIGPNPVRNGSVAFAVALLLAYGVFLARQVEARR